jgi:Tol biopolymer transport system component
MRSVPVRLPLLVVLPFVFSACAAGAASPSATPSQATSSPPAATATPAVSASATASASPAQPKAEGQIVFMDDAATSSHQQLYIERADGSDLRQLVISDVDDYKPSLSPDGTTVVFGRIFDQYTPKEVSFIFVVKSDGTGLKQLDKTTCVRPTCLGELADGLAWSPDGTQLVFYRLLGDAAGKPVNAGLWVMKSDGTGAHQVTLRNDRSGSDDGRAGWSPDGKRLVFVRTTTKGAAIFTVAIDGTDLRQVTPLKLHADDPAWSPDGKDIAFQSPEMAQGVEQSIYTIHPDGTGLTKLTSGMGATPEGYQGSNHPSWSPDGGQIVFAHFPGKNGVADLYVMNRDGSDLHLLAATILNEGGPVWGPSPAPPS